MTDHSMEITYRFFLPDHQDEAEIFQRAPEMHSILIDIYNSCREVWKYKENPTDEEVALAEKIAGMIGDLI